MQFLPRSVNKQNRVKKGTRRELLNWPQVKPVLKGLEQTRTTVSSKLSLSQFLLSKLLSVLRAPSSVCWMSPFNTCFATFYKKSVVFYSIYTLTSTLRRSSKVQNMLCLFSRQNYSGYEPIWFAHKKRARSHTADISPHKVNIVWGISIYFTDQLFISKRINQEIRASAAF